MGRALASLQFASVLIQTDALSYYWVFQLRVLACRCMNQKSGTRAAWPAASTEDIMMVQETMKIMGLYEGAIDGLAGTATLRAVRAYKKSINLAPDNSLCDSFIRHLRNET